MIHFTCDVCAKELRHENQERFIVKMEMYPEADPRKLIEADLEDDHLEAISQTLKDDPDAADLPAPTTHFRFDLCQECQRRFARDPLGKKRRVALFDSEN